MNNRVNDSSNSPSDDNMTDEDPSLSPTSDTMTLSDDNMTDEDLSTRTDPMPDPIETELNDSSDNSVEITSTTNKIEDLNEAKILPIHSDHCHLKYMFNLLKIHCSNSLLSLIGHGSNSNLQHHQKLYSRRYP